MFSLRTGHEQLAENQTKSSSSICAPKQICRLCGELHFHGHAKQYNQTRQCFRKSIWSGPGAREAMDSHFNWPSLQWAIANRPVSALSFLATSRVQACHNSIRCSSKGHDSIRIIRFSMTCNSERILGLLGKSEKCLNAVRSLSVLPTHNNKRIAPLKKVSEISCQANIRRGP